MPSKKAQIQVCCVLRLSPIVTVSVDLVDCSSEKKLDEDNIGYKMLLKAGWKGEGLGVKEDGITIPVSQ